MSVEDLIGSLKTTHHNLETELDQELAHPSPDQIKVHELKREKLRIKDKIMELSGA